LTDDSASIISSMGLSADEWEKFWADFHDIERRAAETDKRIEERKEENARLIERLQRLQKRLERYC
jgi:predicted nuclease with TOPRIM domain